MSNTITIYHNPRCSKSRQTLSLIENAGITPTVVHYLDTPPNDAELRTLLTKLKMSPRDLMRKGEKAYKEMQLADTSLTDSELIKAMLDEPKLIERPIVTRGTKAILGRPPENVNVLL